MRPSGSPKTVAASSNDTLCLVEFAATIFGSHSNSSANPDYTRGLSRLGESAFADPSHDKEVSLVEQVVRQIGRNALETMRGTR